MLFTIVFLLIIFISFVSIFTYWIWSKVSLKMVQFSTGFLVLSLPFERIPSIDFAGVTFRISQLLVIFIIYLLIILWIKKDKDLLAVRVHPVTKWIALFFVAMLPSWFFIQDFKKFLVSFVATVLVFFATLLVTHFLVNPWLWTKRLMYIFIIVGLFGIYQFVGDMVGLPYWLTGLREGYTKITFGVPRVHATFLEPLYFAGALFIPIFLTAFATLADINLIPKKIHSKIKSVLKLDNLLVDLGLVSFFLFLFVLTISKGAIITLLAMALAVLVISIMKLPNPRFFRLISVLGATFFTLLLIFNFTIPKVNEVFDGLIVNVTTTIQGKSPSAVERSMFLNSAITQLDWNYLTGIGPGQYGVNSSILLGHFSSDTSSLIVNNVYVEVWLELGFVAFMIFVTVLLYALYRIFLPLKNRLKWNDKDSVLRLALGMSLVAYIIQWNTFSPIYIMPIFILLGMIFNLDNNNANDYDKENNL